MGGCPDSTTRVITIIILNISLETAHHYPIHPLQIKLRKLLFLTLNVTEEDFVGDPSLGVSGVQRDVLAGVENERVPVFGADL